MDLSRGRPTQRGRTRTSLLNAAAVLIARGLTPTTTEVADAAGVSRRTAYRYFPTQEQLLVEASLERLRPQVEAAMEGISRLSLRAGEDPGRQDVAWAVARLEATIEVINRLIVEYEPLLRTIQRLTTMGETSPGIRARGSRRIDWLTAAVDPVRTRLGPERFARLVSSLVACVGFDSFFVLRDLRGLSIQEAGRVTRFLARAALDALVAEADSLAAEGGAASPGVA